VIGSATLLTGLYGVAMLVFIVLVVISNLIRDWLIVILSGGMLELLQ
jgi:hypothetical protein